VVEFHSLSKSLSLAGWRVGFAVGDPDIIDGLARVKAFCDAGVPSPQQRALVHLLPVCDELFDHTRLHFADQQRALRAALAPLALELFESDAGMFCWLRPGRPGVEFARACMAAGVVLVPGQVFGPGGADCARISATLPQERMGELAGRLGRILDQGSRD
jgi:aspartate/methionine/tyrosine aminotransferase